MLKEDNLNDLLCTGYHEVFGEFGFYFAQLEMLNHACEVIWLQAFNNSDFLYPNNLAAFEHNLKKITFITYQNEHEAYWVLEEILRSGAVKFVIIEGVKQPNLLQSRRLNLAAQKGKSKAFILLKKIAQSANSAMSRWQIDIHQNITDQYQIKLLRSRKKGFISGKENWIMDIKNETLRIDLLSSSGIKPITKTVT